MQVICPWCQTPVPVDAAAPAGGGCPHCGKPLVPNARQTMRGIPIGPETISDHHRSVPPSVLPADDEPIPRAIGRYSVLARVGSGGFGCVYRGYDEELYREVAIKVPHRHRLVTPEDIAAYRDEARVLARLDHPGIVPVFDVGQDEAGAYYLVSKFVKGADLAQKLREGGLSIPDAARVIARVADALHHAHERGLVHRDIKPGNILLDEEGKPYVTDFGLALSQEDFASGPTFAGTPVYMSPEQARSEGHRVDRRTDVFSLGVVFYELLTGRPPFQGETVNELLEQITSREAQPPHHLNEAVPRELERICLKALSKRASDRYQTAKEMAEDLDHWLAQAAAPVPLPAATPVTGSQAATAIGKGTATEPDTDAQTVRVVPKGLRPFDARDSEFFLELLPGPRDRDGLPASIRFWKTRLESIDPAAVTAVNLIYGPSGCGKSSLVRAGLLPRLAAHVTPLYVEAAREGTERRILGGLWHLFPDLAGETDVASAVGALRRGRLAGEGEDQGSRLKTHLLSHGRKLVIVIDQFEQFLHGAGDKLAATPLVAALRQADGLRVQFLLSMREDFWLAGQRLFQELEVPLVEGQNVELIDLFDQRHARRVLILFGQAHGCLPARPSQMTAEQRQFLDQAVAGLSEDGKVIPVRLSLFAEMMKHKPWTPQSLHAVGGPQGVGLAFLQENFPSGPHARPDRKAIEKAARGVLAALLPEPGSDIKGRIRGVEELQAAAGLEASPHRFERLLDLLDRDLRIITPTEPPAESTQYSVLGTQPSPAAVPGSTSGVRAADGLGRFYQLTHDFLVPPLREWLAQRKKETWRGRAELCLQERAAQWSRAPEDRFLPSPLEYLMIFFGVPPTRRRPEEHAVMRAATWFYGRIAAAVLVVGALAGWWAYEASGRSQARSVVRAIENADVADLPRLMDEDLPRYRRWADGLLRAVADDPKAAASHRLRANVALLPVEPQRADALKEQMLDCGTEEFRLVRDRLARPPETPSDPLTQLTQGDSTAPPLGHQLAPFFWQVLHDPGRPEHARFRAGMALAAFDLGSDQWTSEDAGLIVDRLLASGRDEQRDLRKLLTPLGEWLQGPLTARFRDASARPTVRTAAADALAEFAADNPLLLAELVSEAEPEQYDVLHAALLKRAPAAVRSALRGIVCDPSPPPAGEQELVRAGRRRAGAAIELATLGVREPPCLLQDERGDPEMMTQLIRQVRDRHLPPQALLDFLAEVKDATVRFTVLLALGEFDLADVAEARREGLRDRLVEWYAGEPSSALHAASGWLLRRWGFDAQARQVERTPRPYEPGREWFVEQVGDDFLTFVVFEPQSFQMGSPDGEAYRRKNEHAHKVTLTRRFAVCDREVTRALYERLVGPAPDPEVLDLTDEHPAVGVTWAEAVGFCRKLTAKAGHSEDEQCYVAAGIGEQGQRWEFRPERPGYRLATEAEWELACRAGTTTPYGFGSDRGLLDRYGRYLATSPLPVGRLRPNLRGLFDMHGNAMEWCQDWYQEKAGDGQSDPVGPEKGQTRVLRGGSWESSAWHCRSAARHQATPDTRDPGVGFRIVKTLP